MHFFVKYFLMFLFFSSVGWLLESLYCSIGPVITGKTDHFKFVNRGFLSGPVTPIYGVSCLVMMATLLPFRNNVLALFFLGIVVCDVVEYLTSVLMEKLFHARWWDYTGYFLNLNGRICFWNSLIWGILSVVFVKGIYPGVSALFDRLLDTMTWEGIIGLTFLLMGIFAEDLRRTVVATLDISRLIHRVHQARESLLENREQRLNAFEEEVRQNYVEELRSSVTHLTGWRHYRIKRLLAMYPQLSAYFSETREELADAKDLPEFLSKLQFFLMDLESFLSQEKNEMY